MLRQFYAKQNSHRPTRGTAPAADFQHTLPSDYQPRVESIPKKTTLDESKLFIRKIGQWPSHQIKADKEILSFLTEDDKGYYNKALICISQNYGVAAFAYLRKIVEKEIVRIIELLAEDANQEGEQIKSLLSEYRTKKQMAPLVENIFPYLPSALKSLGDNPFKLLYGYLSEGLHNLSDEECLKKAVGLDKLFQFTIRKVREEQSQVREIKELMKGLRSK